MTRRWLSIWVCVVLVTYAVALVLGITLKLTLPETNPAYPLFKDLIPFVIAIPAAWLGHCFARRLSYLQHLRDLWHRINHAVHLCLQYVGCVAPTESDYRNALLETSIVIDEVRGAFKNVGEKRDTRGLYPFEEIKRIHELVAAHVPEGRTEYQRTAAGEEITRLWQQLQQPFLSEFDRAEPSIPSTPYRVFERSEQPGTHATADTAAHGGGSDGTDLGIRIASALVDPQGGDVETITLENHSARTVSLSGWQLRDRAGRTESLGGEIPPGKSASFRVSEVILSNRGGAIELLSPDGLRADRVEYSAEDARESGKAISFRKGVGRTQ